jgi:hypothetical protein
MEYDMKITTKTAVLTVALALAASPALAVPPVVPGSNGNEHSGDAPSKHQNTPGPHASLPAKAKAYGRYCQGFSKKHVAGTPGTPFSKCVTDMAKLATHKSGSPRQACRDQSKKHVSGEKGTPFSRCVVAGAKLLHDQDS